MLVVTQFAFFAKYIITKYNGYSTRGCSASNC